jgi:hypothetical protein
VTAFRAARPNGADNRLSDRARAVATFGGKAASDPAHRAQKKADSDRPSASQSRASSAAVGLASPRSIREIIARLTPAALASWSSVKFCPSRNDFSRSPMAPSNS